ncbi:MAG: phosphoribosyltransferase family protein [Desulfobulbaceae bacterium]|nr:phosphoribosyltransferase family protein [Desulfobulbaceae bacterium]
MAKEVDLYPLRAAPPGQYLSGGVSYPRGYVFSDGSVAPLFKHGVLSALEIGEIAQGTALSIAQRYGGQRLLVVVILEGGRCFGEMVIEELAALQKEYALHYEVATIQIRSYGQGSQAARHKVLQPLRDPLGREIRDCAGFDGVLLVDDLIDGGATLAWLIGDYLPLLSAKVVGVYTMLEKERQRSRAIDELLAGHLVWTGKRVSDEWLVGYGLDLALPGGADGSTLHLFRQALPGGIYAFNEQIEQRLTAECQLNPQSVIQQLGVYLSSR